MTDVPIRGVDPSTLARIDATAARTGVSPNALLNEVLARHADAQEPSSLSDEHFAAFGDSVRDLLDDDLRADAWRR